MLKVKNKTISFNRGENVSLRFKVWNTDGTPYIIPPSENMCLRGIADALEIGNGNKKYVFFTPLLNTGMITVILTSRGACSIEYLDTTGKLNTVGYTGSNRYVIATKCSILSITANDISKIKLTSNGYTFNILNNNDINTLVFTVKDNQYGNIVLCKILNMQSSIMQESQTDYTCGGWNKFSTYDIIESDSEVQLKSDLELAMQSGKICVGKCGDNYYHLVLLKDGTLDIRPYLFEMAIPVLHEDTNTLIAKEYVYDLILYNGTANDIMFNADSFLYDDIVYKKELIEPNTLILGDTNNA